MNDEKAAVMVEAVLVFPMVLLSVFLLIYLGLFKMQEMAMLYQVQRASHQGAMLSAVPGYNTLGDYSDIEIDFTSEPDDVEEYYKKAHETPLTLYREIFGCGGYMGQSELEGLLNNLCDSTRLLSGGRYADKKITLRRSLFSTKITSEVIFEVETPGVMKFFEDDDNPYPDALRYGQAAISDAIYPAGFVRNVDLAGDACVVVSEKLGIKGSLDKILECIRKLF